MLDQHTTSDVSRCDGESIHTEIIKKIRALLVKRCREKLDSNPVGFFVQSLDCVKGQFKPLYQFLRIGLLLRVCLCRRARGSLPLRTENLELYCVCAGPLRSTKKREGPFFISTMVEACFRNHIETF